MRVRALRPFQADDDRLLAAVNRGDFAINGLRNRDLQGLQYDPPTASHRFWNPEKSSAGPPP